LYPPATTAGIYASVFLLLLLGGKLYTWTINYPSVFHCLPIIGVIKCLAIISLNNPIEVANFYPNLAGFESMSFLTLRNKVFLFYNILVPVIIGFLGGPVLKYLGRLEKQYNSE
jgi:hypothetical protein